MQRPLVVRLTCICRQRIKKKCESKKMRYILYANTFQPKTFENDTNDDENASQHEHDGIPQMRK